MAFVQLGRPQHSPLFPSACSLVYKSLQSSAPRSSTHATLPRATRYPARQFHPGRRLDTPSSQYRGGARPSRTSMYPDPMRKANLVVGGTIAVCTGIFLYSRQVATGVPPDALFARVTHAKGTRVTMRQFYDNMVVSRRNLNEGRWWTLVTHTFTHIYGWHIGINMLSLWGVGRPIVAVFGTPTYAFTWLATGAGAAAISAYWPDIKRAAYRAGLVKTRSVREDADRSALGASGSICGLLGVMTALLPRRYAMSTSMFCAFSVWCYNTGVLPTLGHLDHVSGVAGGILIGLLLRGRWRIGFRY